MKTKKLKKVISLVLSLTLFVGVVQVPFSIKADAEETTDVNALYDVDEAHKDATTLSGGLKEGTTFTLSTTNGSRTRIMTKESYPIRTLSFDYGYRHANNEFGEFGVFKGEYNTSGKSEVGQQLVFFYRIANQQIKISVKWSNWQEVFIGEFSASDIRPGDTYWAPNISNFSFVKVGEHWHLAVDGAVCNNVAGNFDYSCLEYAVGSDFFENNTQVHLYFGGWNSGTGYFKQLSAASADGVWESRAVESYKYYLSGCNREYRGQGLNSAASDAKFVHSAIPGAATAVEGGHIVDFSGTDGYAQTTKGYDLKTTKFYVAPIAPTGSTDNLWYYLGFTANPAVFQYHNAKPGDTIELYAASVYNNNYTGAWFSKNDPATEVYAEVGKSVIDYGRFGQWRTHHYESDYTTPKLCISFVQSVGTDGNTHWYMQTTVSGVTLITKSDDVEKDKYLQFDSIIDKPVYFRMGSHGTASNLKMYCKIESTVETAIDTIYHKLDEGAYTIEFSNGATLNNTVYAKDATVSKAGEYNLKYVADSKNYVGKLVLYRLGDTNVDDMLDIFDLIVLAKKMANARDLNLAGLKAADLNADSNIDASDIILLRQKLVE